MNVGDVRTALDELQVLGKLNALQRDVRAILHGEAAVAERAVAAAIVATLNGQGSSAARTESGAGHFLQGLGQLARGHGVRWDV